MTQLAMTVRGSQAGERKRLLALDGLRGIAVLAVCLFHTTQIPRGGWLGVDLFFVLSGFLITSTILDDIDDFGEGVFRNSDAVRFYYRRAFRILPALFEMCLLYAAIKLLNPRQVTHFTENVRSALLLYSNWARAEHWGYPDYLGHTWSLSIEEQFYVLWPVVLLIFLRSLRGQRRLAVAIAVGILAIAAHRFLMADPHADFDRLYNGTDMRIDAILIGCLIGILFRQGRFQLFVAKRARWMGALALAGSGAIVSMIGTMDWQNPWFYRFGLPIFNVSTAAMIVYACAFPNVRAVRCLSWAPLTFTGKRSYGIYLFHFPIFMALYFLYGQMPGWACAVMCLVPTFALATLSWKYVESPFLRMKRQQVPRAATQTNNV